MGVLDPAVNRLRAALRANPPLTAAQRAQLACVFADAIVYRDLAPEAAEDDCAACQPGEPCTDHLADRDKADSYTRLAIELGIQVTP